MANMEFKNNARSTVADNPLAAGATILNVAPGEGNNFPSSFPFLITIWDSSPYPGDDSEMEIVKCTGRTTDALTIVRAQEGTADVAHSNGEKVAMLITAGHLSSILSDLATHESDTSTHGVTGTILGTEDKDVANGIAGLDASTNLVCLTGVVLITRDGSNYFVLREKTSNENAIVVLRNSTADYSVYAVESGVNKRIQTESMKDAASGIAGLDASSNLIANVPLTNLNDVDEQSFTNLLKNGDFESWSSGAAAAPDRWTLIGAGASVARSADEKIGAYNVEITRSGADVMLKQETADFIRYRSKKVTMGCWVKTSQANAARIRAADFTLQTFSNYHSGGGDWEWLTVTHTVHATTSFLAGYCTIHTTNCTVYFDGAILVEGSVCPAFSPKPLVDDGIMLQSNTPSAANDYGKTGQWCYDASYIYICTAIDTWKRVAIAGW